MRCMARARELSSELTAALIDAGFTSPSGRASVRQLALASGIQPATLSRLFRGGVVNPSRDVVKKVAEALGQDPATLSSWIGSIWTDGRRPYEPPEGSEVLTPKQREIVDQIITAFIEVSRHKKSPPPLAFSSAAVAEISRRTKLAPGEVAKILKSPLGGAG
ncbi:MAG: helix-turn-helix transcriptional regulator [Gordonia sp. (in: high G+C Gram-positive bacteria)]